MTGTIGVIWTFAVGDQMVVGVVWQLSPSEGDAFWYRVTARVRALPHSTSPAPSPKPCQSKQTLPCVPQFFSRFCLSPKTATHPFCRVAATFPHGPKFLSAQFHTSRRIQGSRIFNPRNPNPENRPRRKQDTDSGTRSASSQPPSADSRSASNSNPRILEASGFLCFLLVSAVLANAGSGSVLTKPAPVQSPRERHRCL